MQKLFSILFFILLNVIPETVVAQQNEVYFKGLKERYLRLRNTDSEVEKVSDWEKLADEFISYANKNPQADGAASALNNASILIEQLYRFHGEPKRLQQVNTLLTELSEKYKDSPLADDAIKRRAEIYLSDWSDKETALALYQKIVKEFQDSDMHDVALIRIAQIKDNLPSKQEATTTRHTKKEGQILIVLDPGHGGEDFGAVGVGGLLEKDVVLAIALQLQEILEKDPRIVVKLTRRTDEFIPLSERTAFANSYNADLFISLHINASEDAKAAGVEVYYLDNTQDSAAIKMAERENASIKYEGAAADLYMMLSEMIQNAKLEDSIALAKDLHDQIISEMERNWSAIKGRGVKKAPFYVLVGTHMPCVLAELFFISNQKEGEKLGKEEFRKDLALGMAQGIQSFLKHYNVDK